MKCINLDLIMSLILSGNETSWIRSEEKAINTDIRSDDMYAYKGSFKWISYTTKASYPNLVSTASSVNFISPNLGSSAGMYYTGSTFIN